MWESADSLENMDTHISVDDIQSLEETDTTI